MQAVIIGITTTIVGIIITILISRHYYSRSSKNRLAVYWMPSPSIFRGVDPEIRRGLSIKFHDETVQDLSVVEFLVANEGAHAIRNAIEPLTFEIGDKCRIVDASVTYVQPQGRVIEIEIQSDSSFKCTFPLLNPNEYFYVKVIADGIIRRSQIGCTITAEDLPPRLQIESAEGVSIGADESRFSWGLLVAALIVLVIGASLMLPIVGLYESHPSFFPFSWANFGFGWWLDPALIIVTLAATVIAVIGLAMAVTAFVGDIPPRQRFKRPGRPYVPYYWHYGLPPGAEIESATIRHPRE